MTGPTGPGAFIAVARERGALALCWRAHGLWYGIPASVDAEVRAAR